MKLSRLRQIIREELCGWVITLDCTGVEPIAISATREDRGVGVKIGWLKVRVMADNRAEAIRLAKEEGAMKMKELQR